MKPLFEAIFTPLDRALGSIPFAAARWIVVAFLVLAALLPLALSKDFIYLGSPDRARVRDLRLWALVIMVPYILIYLLF